MNFRDGGRKRWEPSLDLTPLIDAMFLLLIFFLVTATAGAGDTGGLPMELPSGDSGEGIGDTAPLTLYVRADGTLRVDGGGVEPVESASAPDVFGVLEGAAAAGGVTLHLRAEAAVPYGQVMELLDRARLLGFQEVVNVISVGQPTAE
ncbi:MAG: biopolymer transporter ExbD [Myxococcales bacterium]|nr:biopolymer transporter ExbD [Myxococcales bacterium]